MESGWRHLVNNFWKQPVVSIAKASVHLNRWFLSPVGKRMLAQEMALIEQCRREHKGSTVLQISGARVPFLGKPSHKRLKIMLSPALPSKNGDELDTYPRLVSDLESLPLEEGSIDFLLLHHSLEFSKDPHAILREASRVLSPQGHMVIVCFNPYSFFGLRKSMQLILGKVIPWAHHGLSRGRISDWLKLMGCEPLNVAFGFYAFPFQSEPVLKYGDRLDQFLSNRGLPGGGFYVIHACKEVGGWVGTQAVKNRPGRLIKFPAVAMSKNYKEID